MSDAPYLGDNIDILLGQEFLTWLWFRSEVTGGMFQISTGPQAGSSFHVTLEQRLVVRGGEGDHKETASVSGSFSPLREARLGLSTGKKVVRALVRFSKDENDWQLTLKAEDFALGSLRTPAIAKAEEGDDPDASFLEKIYLIESCLELLDEAYHQFLKVRLSQEAWKEEIKAVNTWINHDISKGAL